MAPACGVMMPWIAMLKHSGRRRCITAAACAQAAATASQQLRKSAKHLVRECEWCGWV